MIYASDFITLGENGEAITIAGIPAVGARAIAKHYTEDGLAVVDKTCLFLDKDVIADPEGETVVIDSVSYEVKVAKSVCRGKIWRLTLEVA